MASTVTYLDAQSLRSSKNEAIRSYICASGRAPNRKKRFTSRGPTSRQSLFVARKKSSGDPGGEVAAFWV